MLASAIAAVLVVAAACVLSTGSPALAAGHNSAGRPCALCHHKSSDEYSSPHGYYGVDVYGQTDKCRMCHDAHEAANSQKLLIAATTTALCNVCHDNTASWGEYGQIVGAGGTVRAEHSYDVTTAVPGGSTPLSAVLGCVSCHSVHKNTVAEDFISEDQNWHINPTIVFHNKLLKDDVGGHARRTYTKYGAAWCGGCHDRRMNGGAVNNHPVSSTAPYDIFGTTSSYSSGGFGSSSTNAGFTFDPVPPNPDGRISPRPPAPICQHCHEDARNVESAWSGNPWAPGPTWNPAFFNFPHQTTNQYFLVETEDDLCLNCHLETDLP